MDTTDNIKNKLIKLFSDFVENSIGATKKEVPLIKKFQEEKMQATEVVYEPDKLDSHENWMSKSTVELLYERLKKAFFEDKTASLNLFHLEELEKSDAEVIDIYLQESDIFIGDDLVKEGTCIATVQYYNKELWEMRKQGIVGGLSVQGRCKYLEPGDRDDN